jgi:hypothetical protein
MRGNQKMRDRGVRDGGEAYVAGQLSMYLRKVGLTSYNQAWHWNESRMPDGTEVAQMIVGVVGYGLMLLLKTLFDNT